jgi:hypothetical protein
MQEAYPAFKYMCTDSSIAVAPKNVIDEHGAFLNNRRTPTTPDFGVWVKGNNQKKRTSFKASCSLHSFVFFCIYPIMQEAYPAFKYMCADSSIYS